MQERGRSRVGGRIGFLAFLGGGPQGGRGPGGGKVERQGIWQKGCQKRRPNLPEAAAHAPSPRYIL